MAMSTSGGGAGGSMLTEINVTPLVDVMLVLLIIFMVTAPMLQTGVDVDLPEAKAQTIPDDEGKLILTVTKDKRVFLGKMQIPFDDVEKILQATTPSSTPTTSCTCTPTRRCSTATSSRSWPRSSRPASTSWGWSPTRWSDRVPPEKKRRASRRNFAGLLITLALHGAILGAVSAAHSKSDEPLDMPRDFVVAKLVKLGKPREKFWLPRITQPPRPKAPPATIKIVRRSERAPRRRSRRRGPTTRRSPRICAARSIARASWSS